MTMRTVEPKIQSLKVVANVSIRIQSFGTTATTPGIPLECEVEGARAEEFAAKLQALFEEFGDQIPF